MKIELMTDKFRLLGYRLVAESRDEERILNIGEWTAVKECFGRDTAIQLLLAREPEEIKAIEP